MLWRSAVTLALLLAACGANGVFAQPVTDQYLDELAKKFPGVHAAYDKLAATLRQ